MASLLIIHIAAGSFAIGAGAGAAFSLKGAWTHRFLGTVFCLTMTVMAILGGYLALSTTSSVAAAPPQASLSVAALTLYLIFTAWLTVHRQPGALGWAEYGAGFAVASIAVALLIFGIKAAQADRASNDFVPYFVFAGFAIIAAFADLRLITKGGVSGATRITRHLWRMCFAWFFATAFFFLGQQRVMPFKMRGSLFLVLLAIAPLIVMLVWIIRISATAAAARKPSTILRRLLGIIALKEQLIPRYQN